MHIFFYQSFPTNQTGDRPPTIAPPPHQIRRPPSLNRVRHAIGRGHVNDTWCPPGASLKKVRSHKKWKLSLSARGFRPMFYASRITPRFALFFLTAEETFIFWQGLLLFFWKKNCPDLKRGQNVYGAISGRMGKVNILSGWPILKDFFIFLFSKEIINRTICVLC